MTLFTYKVGDVVFPNYKSLPKENRCFYQKSLRITNKNGKGGWFTVVHGSNKEFKIRLSSKVDYYTTTNHPISPPNPIVVKYKLLVLLVLMIILLFTLYII